MMVMHMLSSCHHTHRRNRKSWDYVLHIDEICNAYKPAERPQIESTREIYLPKKMIKNKIKKTGRCHKCETCYYYVTGASSKVVK
jgi:hypothetical protein